MLSHLNTTPEQFCSHLKQGWIKKRSRHLKQWRKRYTTIEENKFFCTYQNEEMTNCTEKIDISESTIQYTIDKPKEFKLFLNKNNNNGFHFECESIIDANEWLLILKKITMTSPHSPKFNQQKPTITNKNEMNDLNLITSPTQDAISNNPLAISDINNNNTNLEIYKDSEVNELYMKAVSLYQHKHYEECERITKSVIQMDPDHPQALQLCQYLVNKRYNNDNNNNKNKNKKGIRQRFKTVAVTKGGSDNNNNNKKKSKNIPMRRTFALFGKKTDNKIKYENDNNEIEETKQVENAAKITLKLLKGIEDLKEQKQTTQQIHPCQLEFKRFLRERIQLNKYYNNLLERFEIAKYDDIRFLKDFDKELLIDEISLRPLHVKCFLRKVEIFMDEIKLFHEWLKNIVKKQKLKERFNNITSDGLIDMFENNGIITFEGLYRYIENKNDLEKIVIGDDNETKFNKIIYDVLWNEMQKMEKTQTIRMSMVAQSYSQVNKNILGIINNDNDDNIFGRNIIPEMETIDNEINDSLEDEGVENNETDYIVH